MVLNKEVEKLNKKAKEYAASLEKLEDTLHTVIVGQKDAVRKVLICLISQGNVLLEGVPGIAKTLLVKTLSSCLDGSFARLQFTPDLLPADIIGTKIYDHKKSSFKTTKGPIFAHFVLADEINRAPPKVQSALLEAMQEKQVTIQGETHMLPSPFIVLATQNPIESEGTYHLPEAQVDRFMFKLLMHYPSKKDELVILDRFTRGDAPFAKKVLSLKELEKMQEFVHQIYVDETVKEYAVDIVDLTRHPEKFNSKELVEWGVSPRASLWLIIGAKAHALFEGRGYVTVSDVKAVAHDVLRHRILLSYEAEAENITCDTIIDRLLDIVPVP